jgi:hypothetical protein
MDVTSIRFFDFDLWHLTLITNNFLCTDPPLPVANEGLSIF